MNPAPSQRPCTAPLLERELGVAAGFGFIGKNTVLITPGVGSYTDLGTLLTSVPFGADRPTIPRCGRCDLCLRACPTSALFAAHHLDTRRCISYLTIEHRGPIDPSLMERMSLWGFGCDVCQQVFPFNHPASTRAGSPPLAELLPQATGEVASTSFGDNGVLELAELLTLRRCAYRRLTRDRALARASRAMWQPNAAIAAGKPQQPSAQNDGLCRQTMLTTGAPGCRASTRSTSSNGSRGHLGGREFERARRCGV